LFTEDPLLQGTVDYLEDDDCLMKQDDCEKLVELYEVCYTLLFSGMPPNFDETPRERLSYAVAGALPLDLLWKQQILELRSEAERQDRLLRYLREWALHLHKMDTRRQGGEGIGHGLN
jgi:Lon protease-like protein